MAGDAVGKRVFFARHVHDASTHRFGVVSRRATTRAR
jgi:hypothetical protein